MSARLVDNRGMGFCLTMPTTRHLASQLRTRLRWVLSCALLGLTACGGGGSGEAPSTLGMVVGAWRDSSSPRTTLAALILPNGAYWAFYEAAGDANAGFEQGIASATGTSLRASTMEYPNSFDAFAVNVSAQMGTESLTGTRSWSTGNNTGQHNFVLTPIPSNDFLAQQIQVSHVQGAWAGTLSGSSASLQVPANSNGQFSGSGGSSGCNFEGTLTPQTNAYAYDVNMTFSGCSLAGTGTTGVAMVYKTSGGTHKQLLMAVVKNSDRSRGWFFSLSQ